MTPTDKDGMRLSRVDSILIALFMGTALFAAYTLGWIGHTEKSLNLQSVVAEITFKKNSVKRKRTGLLAWQDALPMDSLSYGDQIYTHNDSTAEINFKDSLNISIKENSLFKIEEKNGKSELNIKKGLLYLKIEKEMPEVTINISGKSIELKGEKATVQIDSTKPDGRVTVISGSVELKSNQETIVVKENEEAKITETKTEIKKLTLIPTHPLSESTVFTLPDGAPLFTFNALEGAGDYTIELSQSSDFIGGVIKHSTKQNELQIVLGNEGVWYWRIRGISKDGLESLSTVTSFEYKKIHPVKIRYPEENSHFFLDETSELTVNFEKDDYETFEYKLVQGEKEQSAGEITDDEIDLDLNTKGTFTFMIRPKIDSSLVIPFTTLHFNVFKRVPVPFKDLSPRDREIITPKDAKEKITLSWETKPSPIETTISIWNDNKLIIETKTSDTSFTLPSNLAGEISWKLRATIEENIVESPKEIFKIELPKGPTAPSIDPSSIEEIKVKVKKIKKERTFLKILDAFISSAHADELIHEARLEWPKVDGATSYQLQIFTDKEMSKTLLEVTTEDSFYDWKNPSTGILYFRVKAIDSWNRSSPYSGLVPIKIFIDEEDQEIKEVLFVTPKNGEEITLENDQSLKFTWEADKQASRFRFMIAKDPELRERVYETQTKENDLKILQNIIGYGNRYARILAFDQYDRARLSKKIGFKVSKPTIWLVDENKKLKLFTLSVGANNSSYKLTDATTNISADGLIYTGAKANYLSQNPHSTILIDFSRYTGKFFSQNYEEALLALFWGKPLSTSFSLLGGLALDRTTSMTRNNNQLVSQLKTDASLHTSILHLLKFSNSILLSRLDLGYPSLSYTFSTSLLLGAKFIYGPSFEYRHKEKEIETKKISIDEMKLLFSFGRKF